MGCRLRWFSLFVSAVLFFSLQQSNAAQLPKSPAEPTGCAGTPPGVKVRAIAKWGLVPFTTILEVTDPYGLVNSVAWDFDGDGTIDAYGNRVEHRFFEAVDQTVRAWIISANQATSAEDIVISGYLGLMSITFDDGTSSVFDCGLPVLQDKHVQATAYIVPGWVGTLFYMDWEAIDSLQATGWEIGSHSMTHPDLTALDDSSLHYELQQSQAELRIHGFPAEHFAAPFASVDGRVIQAIRQHYASNRIAGGLNPDLQAVKAYRLKSDFSHSSLEFEHYRARIDSTAAAGGWYILSNHVVISSGGPCSWCVTQQMLSDVIAYAEAARLRILTIGEGLVFCMRHSMPEIPIEPDDYADGPDVSITAASEIHIQASNPNRLDLPISIGYRLSEAARVRLSAYSVEGRLIAVLADEYRPAGSHRLTWDDTETAGSRVGPGIYFLRIETPDRAAACKMVLVK